MHCNSRKRDDFRAAFFKRFELFIKIIGEKIKLSFGNIIPRPREIDALDRDVRHSLAISDPVDSGI